MSKCKTVQEWQRTSVQNLVRRKSGIYYARSFSNGNERWKSLKTTVLEVAKHRLRDTLKAAATEAEAPKPARSGRMTMGEAIAAFRGEIATGTPLRGKARRRHNQESSKHYREQTLAALVKSWRAIIGHDLEPMEVRKVAIGDVKRWASAYADEVSSTRFNNTLGSLRRLFEIAMEAGELHRNPAAQVARADVQAKKLVLPERETFPRFVQAIRESGSRYAPDSADFVEFLAYTGARKTEGASVLWGDVDFVRGYVHLRETKNGEPRRVPMIAEARQLLERLRKERPDEPATAHVLRVTEARGSMDTAAAAVGMARITHHDLRHLFATVAIESGVDIPTVSRWLGHKDGGALALRTYGHLRDEHSAAAAQRVSFAPAAPAANIIELGKVGAA
jgi:integrase